MHIHKVKSFEARERREWSSLAQLILTSGYVTKETSLNTEHKAGGSCRSSGLVVSTSYSFHCPLPPLHLPHLPLPLTNLKTNSANFHHLAWISVQLRGETSISLDVTRSWRPSGGGSGYQRPRLLLVQSLAMEWQRPWDTWDHHYNSVTPSGRILALWTFIRFTCLIFSNICSLQTSRCCH